MTLRLVHSATRDRALDDLARAKHLMAVSVIPSLEAAGVLGEAAMPAALDAFLAAARSLDRAMCGKDSHA
jgi:hypothetical protein